MTPLRQQMIDAMQQRGFSVRTHETYLAAVSNFAKYYHTPPDEIQLNQIQEYFVYLVKQRGLSGATCRVYFHALRFLYLQVLEWDHFDVPIHYPKRAQKIPELLTRCEVKQILDACDNDKHRMMLTICYGCGLRVSELVAIKIYLKNRILTERENALEIHWRYISRFGRVMGVVSVCEIFGEGLQFLKA